RKRDVDKKKNREKKKERIDYDGIVESGEFASGDDCGTKPPQRKGAEQSARQREAGVNVFFLLLDPEIDYQDAQAEENELDLRKDDGAVAPKIADNRIDNRDVHAGGLFRLRHSGREFRWRQFRMLGLVDTGSQLPDNFLNGLFDEGKERLWVDAHPKARITSGTSVAYSRRFKSGKSSLANCVTGPNITR